MNDQLRYDLDQAIGDWKYHEIERSLVTSAWDDMTQFQILSQVKQADFQDAVARAAYGALRQAYRETETVTSEATLLLLSTSDHQVDRKAGEEILRHKMANLDKLLTDTQFAALVSYVRQAATKRRIEESLKRCLAMVARQDWTMEELQKRMQADLGQAWAGYTDRRMPSTEAEVFRAIGDKLSNAEGPHLTTAPNTAGTKYPLGWQELDDIIPGFGVGQVLVVGARPNMGKSAFVLQLLRRLIKKSGRKGILFSLEMKKELVGARALSQELGKPFKTLRAVDAYTVEEMRATGLFIDDQGYNVEGLCRQVELVKMAHPDLEWVAIDYAQLLARNEPTPQAEASKRLARLSHDLGLGVIEALQIGRDVEQRKDTRPMLSDIKESGQWEQDADIAVMLWRPSYYNPKHVDPAEAWAFVRKQRDGGGTGEAKFAFNGSCVSFYDPKSTQGLLVPVTDSNPIPNMF